MQSLEVQKLHPSKRRRIDRRRWLWRMATGDQDRCERNHATLSGKDVIEGHPGELMPRHCLSSIACNRGRLD